MAKAAEKEKERRAAAAGRLREWLRGKGETEVTIRYEGDGGEEATVSSIGVWGREEWVGDWAARRPRPIRITAQSEDGISYTARIPGLHPSVAEITETITTDDNCDRWGRRIDAWELGGGDPTTPPHIIYFHDEDGAIGPLDEEKALALAEKYPDRFEAIEGSRFRARGYGVLGQEIEQRMCELASDYLVVAAAPGVTAEEVGSLVARMEEEEG